MKKYLPFFALLIFLIPLVAFAQNDAPTIVCRIMERAKIIVAAVGFGIAVIYLIVSGIKYMTAGGNMEKATEARKGITNAVIGIVIVAAAIFIIILAQSTLLGVGIDDMDLIYDPCPGPYSVPPPSY